MSYNYKNHRKHIFTDKGQRELLKVRDKVEKLLKDAGAFKIFSPLKGIIGDTWEMMAYVDRLVELGEIREVNQVGYVAGQDRIFVKA